MTPEVSDISIKKNVVIAQDDIREEMGQDSSQRKSYNPRQDKNNYSSAKTPTILVISLYSSVKSPLCEIINCAKGRNKNHKRLNKEKSNNAPNQGVLLELAKKDKHIDVLETRIIFLQTQIGMTKIKQNLTKDKKLLLENTKS